jgi:hypothetical protein
MTAMFAKGPGRGRGRTPKTLALIETITAIARANQPCGVRAIAYQLFVRHQIASMEKKNTKRVSELGTIAREEGTLPWEWITDLTRQAEEIPSWDDPVAFGRAVQSSYRRNKWAGQPVHVEIWSEKTTVASTIRPLLDTYEIPFQVLHGFSSATTIRIAACANLDRKQKTLILYIGDFDPSGLYMSEVDLPQRWARYSSGNPPKEIEIEEAREALVSLDVEIRRVALTFHDTIMLGARLGFPATDKKLDTRYPWFIEHHGHRCWELDAMAPTILRDRLEAAILAELDGEAWDRYVAVEELELEVIADTCQSWQSSLGQVPK